MRIFKNMMGEFTLGSKHFKGLAIDSVTIISDSGDIYNISEADIKHLEFQKCTFDNRGTTLVFLAKAYELYMCYRAENDNAECRDSEAYAVVAYLLTELKGNGVAGNVCMSAEQKAKFLQAVKQYESIVLKGKSFENELWFGLQKTDAFPERKFDFGFVYMTYWDWSISQQGRRASFVKESSRPKWEIDRGSPKYISFLQECYSKSAVQPLFADLRKIVPNAIIGKSADYMQIRIEDDTKMYADFKMNLIVTGRNVDKLTEIFLKHCR